MDKCREERARLAQEFKGLEDVFAALGDENRRRIFIALLENEKVGLRVLEITEITHLSRPAVSHHLQVLKKSGVINMYRDGTKNYYYADANLGVWQSLKNLSEHICATAANAVENNYPNLDKI